MLVDGGDWGTKSFNVFSSVMFVFNPLYSWYAKVTYLCQFCEIIVSPLKHFLHHSSVPALCSHCLLILKFLVKVLMLSFLLMSVKHESLVLGQSYWVCTCISITTLPFHFCFMKMSHSHYQNLNNSDHVQDVRHIPVITVYLFLFCIETPIYIL